MKNLFNYFMIAMIAMALGLAGCSKSDKINGDDDEPDNGNNNGNGGGNTSDFVIEAKNVASSIKEIATVEAKLFTKTFSTKYSNNGFKFSLPKEIPGQFERNPLMLEALDKNGDFLGTFSYGGYKANAFYAINYSYAAENMTYTNQIEYELSGYWMISNYNCVLKKGWNIEYTEAIETGESITYNITTNKPSGVDFSWEFIALDE